MNTTILNKLLGATYTLTNVYLLLAIFGEQEWTSAWNVPVFLYSLVYTLIISEKLYEKEINKSISILAGPCFSEYAKLNAGMYNTEKWMDNTIVSIMKLISKPTYYELIKTHGNGLFLKDQRVVAANSSMPHIQWVESETQTQWVHFGGHGKKFIRLYDSERFWDICLFSPSKLEDSTTYVKGLTSLRLFQSISYTKRVVKISFLPLMFFCKNPGMFQSLAILNIVLYLLQFSYTGDWNDHRAYLSVKHSCLKLAVCASDYSLKNKAGRNLLFTPCTMNIERISNVCPNYQTYHLNKLEHNEFIHAMIGATIISFLGGDVKFLFKPNYVVFEGKASKVNQAKKIYCTILRYEGTAPKTRCSATRHNKIAALALEKYIQKKKETLNPKVLDISAYPMMLEPACEVRKTKVNAATVMTSKTRRGLKTELLLAQGSLKRLLTKSNAAKREASANKFKGGKQYKEKYERLKKEYLEKKEDFKVQKKKMIKKALGNPAYKFSHRVPEREFRVTEMGLETEKRKLIEKSYAKISAITDTITGREFGGTPWKRVKQAYMLSFFSYRIKFLHLVFSPGFVSKVDIRYPYL